MFTPPGENIVEKKKCPLSGEEFVVTDKDVDFYNILSPVFGGQKCLIPTPTLSPTERQIRRMTWRNYDNFYKNTCALTGKEIVSTYRPGTPYRVAALEAWWGDDWDPHDSGKRLDFSRPFFEQFHELDQAALHMPLSVSKSENSTFTNFSIQNKNCYLCSRVAECEDCYYCLLIVRSKHCFDCTHVYDSEYLYECIRTNESYHSLYCTDCENCRDCYFLKDCSGCQDCFGSCNLKNGRFVFNNKQLTESEYTAKLTSAIQSLTDGGLLRDNFLRFCEKFPKKSMTGLNNEDASGNFLFSNAHVVYGFECHESENIRYCYGTVRGRDCIDASFGYICEKSIEICGVAGGYANYFSVNCLNECRDVLYCKDCVSATSDCFGCISLKKGKHCILNTPYSQLEYEKTVIKLIDHMRSTGEWGQFFPAEFSPYAYNESGSQVHFAQSRAWTEKRNWNWFEPAITAKNSDFTPLAIGQYDEKIVGYEMAQKNISTLLAAELSCTETGRNYKIISPELAFYIENSLPIPRKHPAVRSETRMRQTLPVELHDRNCAECGQALLTSYAPDRPERILCEGCYRKLVY